MKGGKPLAFLFALFTSLCANAGKLDGLSRPQLLELQSTVEQRLEYFDYLNALRFGLPAGTSDEFLVVGDSYIKSKDKAAIYLSTSQSSAICQKFATTFKAINNDIEKSVLDYVLAEGDKTKKLLLQSRLEILSYYRSQLVGLVELDEEGGAEMLTLKSSQCASLNRARWKESLQMESEDLRVVFKNLFGVRGLTNADKLSLELAKLNEQRAHSKLVWFLPKLVGFTVVSSAFWEVAVLGGIGSLAASGTLTQVAAANITKLLKVGSMLTSAAMVGYQGYKVGSKQEAELRSTQIEAQFDQMIKFLSLPVDSAVEYYDQIFELEGALISQLLEMQKSSANDLNYIKSNWGDLQKAKDHHKNKLREIKSLLLKKVS